MNEHENELPEEEMDFSKHMQEILKKEAVKAQKAPVAEEKNANKVYHEKYGRSAQDRFWIGKERYR